MILLSIRDIIEQIAQKYGLNTWDWITLLITVTTLIVSSLALVVARKTLKSQKKTEHNTAPIITKPVQEILITRLCESVLTHLYRVIALFIMLEKTNFKTVPSYHFLEGVPKTSDYIHESLFYDNEYKYLSCKTFSEVIDAFCNRIRFIQRKIEYGETEAVNQEMPYLLKWSEPFFTFIRIFLKTALNKNNKYVFSFFNRLIPKTGFKYIEFEDSPDFRNEEEQHRYNTEYHFDNYSVSYRDMKTLFDLIEESSIYNDIDFFAHELTSAYNSILRDVMYDSGEIEKIKDKNNEYEIDKKLILDYIKLRVASVILHTKYHNNCFVDYVIGTKPNIVKFRRLEAIANNFLYDKE